VTAGRNASAIGPRGWPWGRPPLRWRPDRDGAVPNSAAAGRVGAPTPLQLACALDTTLVQTPALALVAHRVADAVRIPRSRVVISVGPQMGKTTVTSVFGSLWALLDDPIGGSWSRPTRWSWPGPTPAGCAT
jgi:hypothetical protein